MGIRTQIRIKRNDANSFIHFNVQSFFLLCAKPFVGCDFVVDMYCFQWEVINEEKG